jgi:transcriptional regulator with XRE-family HTH domain
MTQADLARAADVALITVTRLENSGETANPRPETIRRLARALKVDPAWLLFGEEDLKAAA